MKQTRTKNYIKFFSICVLLLGIMQLQTGCRGCSPSGRRSGQKVRQSNTQSSRNVSTTKTIQPETKRPNNSSKHSLNDLYNKYKNSVFLVYTSDGHNGYQGSGFFISKTGVAVSNYHVFEGTSQGLETIETLDGKKFKILEVLNKSKENDFIIFKVKIGNYNINNPIPIVNEIPQIGEDVFAIGNPRGLESTLSKGIVSGFRENNRLIQTTTEITHGSSGGPLLNMNGEVIGITSSGLGEANLNFAINIKTLYLDRYINR